MDDVKIRIGKDYLIGDDLVAVITANHDGSNCYGAFQYIPYAIYENIPENAKIRLSNDKAQYLMDCLWDCGLRPTEGKGSAGCLAATERHLEDMRKLVFKAC